MHAILLASSTATKTNIKNFWIECFNNSVEQPFRAALELYFFVFYHGYLTFVYFYRFGNLINQLLSAFIKQNNIAQTNSKTNGCDWWIFIQHSWALQKEKDWNKRKNGEERIPTILCMTFRMYNCIRKRPSKKKVKKKDAKLLLIFGQKYVLLVRCNLKANWLTFPRELGMNSELDGLLEVK